MSEERDPRIDPQPGDIVQRPKGMTITVTERDGDRVSWMRKAYGVMSVSTSNSWSLRAWINTVAYGTEVVNVAAKAQGAPDE